MQLETFHLEFPFPLFGFCAKARSFLFHVTPQRCMQPSHKPCAAKPAPGARGGVLAASCHSCWEGNSHRAVSCSPNYFVFLHQLARSRHKMAGSKKTLPWSKCPQKTLSSICCFSEHGCRQEERLRFTPTWKVHVGWREGFAYCSLSLVLGRGFGRGVEQHQRKASRPGAPFPAAQLLVSASESQKRSRGLIITVW